jgi:hypothetical protein
MKKTKKWKEKKHENEWKELLGEEERKTKVNNKNKLYSEQDKINLEGKISVKFSKKKNEKPTGLKTKIEK